MALGSGCSGEDPVCIVHESEEEKCPSTITDLPTVARKEVRARTTAALTEAQMAVRTVAQTKAPTSTGR